MLEQTLCIRGLVCLFLKMNKEVNTDNPQISQELRNLECGKCMFKSLRFIPGVVILKMSCRLFLANPFLYFVMEHGYFCNVSFLHWNNVSQKSIFFKKEFFFSGQVCIRTLRKGTNPNKFFWKKIYQLKR